MAEGPKVVSELIMQDVFEVKRIYAVEEWLEEGKKSGRIPGELITVVKDFELEKLSSLTNPHLVLGVFAKRKNEEINIDQERVTLMLENIRDPGNFGTIIRIADWFGIKSIVCSPGCVDMYNTKVVQSTMASLGRVKLHYEKLESVLERFPQTSLYAAALQGKALPSISLKLPAFLLIGNEGSGISEQLLERADERVSIPGEGGAESLNAAVATGILLYAFRP